MSGLPPEWQEVMGRMANLKKCREANDVKGAGLRAMKLEAWRDAHPKEAQALVTHLSGMEV